MLWIKQKEKGKMYKYLNEIITRYGNRYDRILRTIYPSNIDSGFAEENQTFNFISASEEITKEHYGDDAIISWTQYQVPKINGDKNDNHIDGFIIDTKEKEVFLIESKRLQSQRKCSGLLTDAWRAEQVAKKRAYLSSRLANHSDLPSYSFYLILLADEWTMAGGKYILADNLRRSLFKDSKVIDTLSSSDLGVIQQHYKGKDFTTYKVRLSKERYPFINGYDYYLFCYSMLISDIDRD